MRNRLSKGHASGVTLDKEPRSLAPWNSPADDDDPDDATDDAEAPDPSDCDITDTIACGECGQSVYDDSEICPHCGGFVHGPSSRSLPAKLFIMTAIVCLLVIIVFWIGVHY